MNNPNFGVAEWKIAGYFLGMIFLIFVVLIGSWLEEMKNKAKGEKSV